MYSYICYHTLVFTVLRCSTDLARERAKASLIIILKSENHYGRDGTGKGRPNETRKPVSICAESIQSFGLCETEGVVESVLVWKTCDFITCRVLAVVPAPTTTEHQQQHQGEG